MIDGRICVLAVARVMGEVGWRMRCMNRLQIKGIYWWFNSKSFTHKYEFWGEWRGKLQGLREITNNNFFSSRLFINFFVVFFQPIFNNWFLRRFFIDFCSQLVIDFFFKSIFKQLSVAFLSICLSWLFIDFFQVDFLSIF